MTARHAAEASPPRRALTELARLLLPVDCAGCGERDTPVCRRCRWALTGAPWVDRHVAGVPVVAAVPYAGAAQRILLAWKDDGRHDLAPAVRAALVRSLREALRVVPGVGSTGVLVVAVPSSAGASRRRGGDVLAECAGDAVRRLPDSERPVVWESVLRQRSRVLDQAGLGAEARRVNRHGALSVRSGRRPAGRDVIVVDDVVTTGATLADAVRALRAEGAHVRAAAVVAATPLRRPGAPPAPLRRPDAGPQAHRLPCGHGGEGLVNCRCRR